MKIYPTNDLLFKKVFASAGHEDILLGFVNDMLGMDFQSIQPRETYDIKKITLDRLDYTEVDVRAQTHSGEYVTIEMQVQNHASFLSRTAYYASQTYGKQYKSENKADPYADLKQTYSINIMNFDPFNNSKRSLRHFAMIDATSFEWLADFDTDFVQLSYLMLPNRNDNDSSYIKYWQQFFQGERISSKAPDYIQRAYQLVLFDNLTREEQIMAETITKRQAIRNAEKEYARKEGFEEGLGEGISQGIHKGMEKGIQEGMEKGIQEGMEKGTHEEARRIASQLLHQDMDISYIIELTRLPKEEIESLKDDLSKQ